MALATARRRSVALVGVLLIAAVLLVAVQRADDDRDGSASIELAPEQLSGAASVAHDPAASGGSYVRLAGPSGRAAMPCRGIEVQAGADLGAAVAATPEGATLCLRAGVYRVSEPVRPKDGQRLVGEPGTVVSGARVVTGFTRSGRGFVAAAFLPRDPSTHGECATPGCAYPQDVFLGGVPPTRVLDPGDLEPGRFCQDFRPTGCTYATIPAAGWSSRRTPRPSSGRPRATSPWGPGRGEGGQRGAACGHRQRRRRLGHPGQRGPLQPRGRHPG